MAKVTLNFEDGVTRMIDALPHETVAEAAYRNRLNIPLDCADGACGTCKCFCVSGTFDPGDYIDEALTKEEAAEGFGLACQMRAESDLVIDILTSAEACSVEAQIYDTTVKKVEFLSKEVVKLQLDCQEEVSFLPGQYMNIEIPDSAQRRSYSCSSKPGQRILEFIIRMIPGGMMSMFLQDNIKLSQKIKIIGPLGSFYSREMVRPTLFFAGGTGIAPFISILESIQERGSTVPITLFYGATLAENMVELERLKNFSTYFPLKIYTCVSGDDTQKLNQGYVNQWIDRSVLKEDDYDIYTCGPNAMVESVKQSLHTQGIKYSNFYLEKFLPSG